MVNIGLAILVAACALALSSLQGWALRGALSLVRHLVAWLAGTLLLSAILGAVYRVLTFPHVPSGDRPPALPDGMTAIFHWTVAIGVAAALAAGALHARQAEGDAHERARDLWLGRAVVQGVALFAVGFVGFFVLLFVGLGSVH